MKSKIEMNKNQNKINAVGSNWQNLKTKLDKRKRDEHNKVHNNNDHNKNLFKKTKINTNDIEKKNSNSSRFSFL